jgi:SAM-dependent methyltransferase
MDHVNYEQWANYISYIADIHGQTILVIYDISCGTGTMSFKLTERGYNVFASDLCLEMIKFARTKRKLDHSYPYFWCSDLQYSPLKRKPDMIVCLYDSMNYLEKILQWELSFKNIYALLNPNGLFVFDISTIYNSETFFQKYSYHRICSNGSFTRRSTFDEKKMIQHNIFEIRLNQNPDVIYVEHHQQVIRPLEQIHGVIKRSPFKLVGCYSEFSFKPGTEKAKRVHFVLKK